MEIEVKAMNCPKCDQPTLKQLAVVYDSLPQIFPHECENCGELVHLEFVVRYPG